MPVPRTVTLDGTNASEAVRIPAGAVGFQIHPRSATIDLNWALSPEGAMSNNRAVQLNNGQSYELQLIPPQKFKQFDLFFFATSALVVDVLWW
jgi:hypothetical protein